MLTAGLVGETCHKGGTDTDLLAPFVARRHEVSVSVRGGPAGASVDSDSVRVKRLTDRQHPTSARRWTVSRPRQPVERGR